MMLRAHIVSGLDEKEVTKKICREFWGFSDDSADLKDD